jgi:hypothetical protein
MKHMCEKCKTCSDHEISGFIEAGELYWLCKLCALVVERQPLGNRIHDFLHNKMDLSPIDRDMIEARIRRATGRSMWADPA